MIHCRFSTPLYLSFSPSLFPPPLVVLFAAKTRFAPDTTAALAQILKTNVAGLIVARSTRDSARLTVARAGSALERKALFEEEEFSGSRARAVSSDREYRAASGLGGARLVTALSLLEGCSA